MEEVLEFTKEQLTEAFRQYNTEFLNATESFGKIDDTNESAQLQAEKLISILKTLG